MRINYKSFSGIEYMKYIILLFLLCLKFQAVYGGGFGVTCQAGFYMNGNQCEECYTCDSATEIFQSTCSGQGTTDTVTCACDSAKHFEGRASEIGNVGDCRCANGYDLVNNVCVLKQCTCGNGTATNGIACSDSGTEDCSSCDEYYRLENNKCLKNTCRCHYGIAEVNCSTHDRIQCSSCNTDYKIYDDFDCEICKNYVCSEEGQIRTGQCDELNDYKCSCNPDDTNMAFLGPDINDNDVCGCNEGFIMNTTVVNDTKSTGISCGVNVVDYFEECTCVYPEDRSDWCDTAESANNTLLYTKYVYSLNLTSQRVTNNMRQDECAITGCPAGQELDRCKCKCVNCPSGHFKTALDTSKCQEMVCPEGQIMFYPNVTQAPYCSACDTGLELIGTQCEGCQIDFFNDNHGGQCNQCPLIQTSNENNTGCQNREKEDLKVMYNENCVTSNAMTTVQCKEIIQLFNTYDCN